MTVLTPSSLLRLGLVLLILGLGSAVVDAEALTPNLSGERSSSCTPATQYTLAPFERSAGSSIRPLLPAPSENRPTTSPHVSPTVEGPTWAMLSRSGLLVLAVVGIGYGSRMLYDGRVRPLVPQQSPPPSD